MYSLRTNPSHLSKKILGAPMAALFSWESDCIRISLSTSFFILPTKQFDTHTNMYQTLQTKFVTGVNKIVRKQNASTCIYIGAPTSWAFCNVHGAQELYELYVVPLVLEAV